MRRSMDRPLAWGCGLGSPRSSGSSCARPTGLMRRPESVRTTNHLMLRVHSSALGALPSPTAELLREVSLCPPLCQQERRECHKPPTWTLSDDSCCSELIVRITLPSVHLECRKTSVSAIL